MRAARRATRPRRPRRDADREDERGPLLRDRRAGLGDPAASRTRKPSSSRFTRQTMRSAASSSTTRIEAPGLATARRSYSIDRRARMPRRGARNSGGGALRHPGRRALDRAFADACPAGGDRRHPGAARPRRGARGAPAASVPAPLGERVGPRALAAGRREPPRTASSPQRSPAPATRPARWSRPSTCTGSRGVDALLHEWRGALFRVRLARLRLTGGTVRAARPTEATQIPKLHAPLVASGLTVAGAAAFAVGATAGPWPLWVAGMLAVCLSLLLYRPCSGREPGERLVAPEQLEALEQPGRDLRARDREPDRGERLARLQPLRLGERAQRLLDPGRLPRLDDARAPRRRRAHTAGSAPSGLTGSNRKRTKSGYCENFSIFSCTSGTVARTRSSGQSIPCSREPASSSAAA